MKAFTHQSVSVALRSCHFGWLSNGKLCDCLRQPQCEPKLCTPNVVEFSCFSLWLLFYFVVNVGDWKGEGGQAALVVIQLPSHKQPETMWLAGGSQTGVAAPQLGHAM